ncbi:dienelactone hydrolase family protein [Amycolatopsis sp. NPDC005232]|uniref:dienelactone hydrolase family protein n=1 Tax=Amycolatopsis sp. NPDC005232 TaxID=3157027 RepID=UPI00339FFAAB
MCSPAAKRDFLGGEALRKSPPLLKPCRRAQSKRIAQESICKQNSLHFGGQDPYIPRSDVAVVEAAVALLPGAEIFVQEDAGHAFHNRVAPMFCRPEAAARAWELTTEFLRRTLPV